MSARWMPVEGEQVRYTHGVGVVRCVKESAKQGRSKGQMYAKVLTGTTYSGEPIYEWFHLSLLTPAFARAQPNGRGRR